ncbi:MAG: cobalt ECF transporter T component CbiQ [Butyricicoccaceae bacterium]
MIGTDKYSYASALRRVQPQSKLLLTMVSIVLCLTLDSVAVSLLTVVLMAAVICCMGKIALRDFVHMMILPMNFLLLATITIFIGRFEPDAPQVLGIVLGAHRYGISSASAATGAHIFLRSLAAIASVYFLVLNTPMTDISWALGRLHVPPLFIQLMELIYRFVFVLYEAMHRIRTAQASRLGYHGLARSYRSTGTLAAVLFARAYHKSSRISCALESRGYTGNLQTLEQEYESGARVRYACIGITALQLLCFAAERLVCA